MKDGLIRVAAATPKIKVADVKSNVLAIEKMINEAADRGCAVAVFPELSVTAYTCADLFKDSLLLFSAEEGLKTLIQHTMDKDILCAVGVPVPFEGKLYNCAAVFKSGKLLGLSAKENLPNYAEFYEARYFSPAIDAQQISYAGQNTYIGKNLIYRCENIKSLEIGVEICEDLWVTSPPSIKLAQNGASLILNLSCSSETVGKKEYRKNLVSMQSAHLTSGYVYASSGEGESTTDLVFSGHNIIAENSAVIAESELFTTGIITADIDLERIQHERQRTTTWTRINSADINKIGFEYDESTIGDFEPNRIESKSPFVPNNESEISDRCNFILNMQAVGLKTRLEHIGANNVVMGVSGGLDSTLAMIVTKRAFDMLGLDRSGIKAISMPGFGTTSRTKNNAQSIAKEMGADFSEISIDKAVKQHFEDIGHDGSIHDVTYENAQARERTQILMDLANKYNGIVIGTGDLSELALGWATYNGDHMSMYAVNSGIPKTLIKHLVKYEAENSDDKLKNAILDVLDTPVSPELLPPTSGEISQKTEDIIGPYELHDYFLYYVLRYGFTPSKIYRLAEKSFKDDYDSETIKKWLRVFYSRFFLQQFKRSCLPDGPKIGSVALSPRGDLRMPSDASAKIWIDEIESL